MDPTFPTPLVLTLLCDKAWASSVLRSRGCFHRLVRHQWAVVGRLCGLESSLASPTSCTGPEDGAPSTRAPGVTACGPVSIIAGCCADWCITVAWGVLCAAVCQRCSSRLLQWQGGCSHARARLSLYGRWSQVGCCRRWCWALAKHAPPCSTSCALGCCPPASVCWEALCCTHRHGILCMLLNSRPLRCDCSSLLRL